MFHKTNIAPSTIFTVFLSYKAVCDFEHSNLYPVEKCYM